MRTAIFCLAAICLIQKAMKPLPSIITVSIECGANVIALNQLVLNSAAYLSIDAVSCHTQGYVMYVLYFALFAHLQLIFPF